MTRIVAGIAAGFAIVLLASAAPASAAGNLDQSQTDASAGREAFTGSSELLAQTFTAGITGMLSQVNLLVGWAGTPGDLIVQIRTTSGGKPTNTVLSTATVAPSNVGPDILYWVSVPVSAVSVEGTQYAIVLSDPGLSATCGPCTTYWEWGAGVTTTPNDLYPGGDALDNETDVAGWFPITMFQPNLSADRVFQTYVTPDDLVPPACMLVATGAGPPKQLEIEVQDTGSGIRKITSNQTNADVAVPSFAAGTTDPLMITATKVDQSKGATVALTVTDGGGNVTTCDPRWPAVRHRSLPVRDKPKG